MLTTALMSVVILFADGSAHWPAFLGAGSDLSGASTPTQWSPDSVSWQAAIKGHGQSSPVIWGNRVFVTSVDGPNKESQITTCFDLKTGKQLWNKASANSNPVKNSLYVSRAAPTPVVDGDRVVVQFESGDCTAYSHDGETLWQRKLTDETGPLNAEFGLGASPCQNESHVFVLLEHDGPSYLVALNKQTGKTDWKTKRESRRSWTSPMMLNVSGKQAIVVSSAGSIDGYAPASGNQLWNYTDIGGNTGTTPMDCGEGRFLVGASAGRSGENAKMSKVSNCMMQVSVTDEPGKESWSIQKLWSNAKASPSWASPIHHDGFAYWVNRVGALYCIDASNGETVYTQRLKESCWATPLVVGDTILFFGKGGLTSAVKAGREFEVLSESQLWSKEQLPPDSSLQTEESTAERRQAAAMFNGPTVYGVAATDGKLVIRIGHRLFAIGE